MNSRRKQSNEHHLAKREKKREVENNFETFLSTQVEHFKTTRPVSIGFYTNTIVVYFNQRMGGLHTVCWSNFFSGQNHLLTLNICFHHKREKT